MRPSSLANYVVLKQAAVCASEFRGTRGGHLALASPDLPLPSVDDSSNIRHDMHRGRRAMYRDRRRQTLYRRSLQEFWSFCMKSGRFIGPVSGTHWDNLTQK